jgi:hypothetical protein
MRYFLTTSKDWELSAVVSALAENIATENAQTKIKMFFIANKITEAGKVRCRSLAFN